LDAGTDLASAAATLQLAADYYLANGINSVDLEDRFSDVESDCRDRLHGLLL